MKTLQPPDRPGMRAGQLGGCLEATAAGNPHEEAAVGLLIVHGYWLHRTDFVHQAVRLGEDNATEPGSDDHSIDWNNAVRFVEPAGTADRDAIAVLCYAALLNYQQVRPSPPGSFKHMHPSTRRMANEAADWAKGLCIVPGLDQRDLPTRRVRWPVIGGRMPTICLDCFQVIPGRHYDAHLRRCVDAARHIELEGEQ